MQVSIRPQEYAYRWTPRLLGIAPLLIFSITLFSQGGPARGLWMVLILQLLIAMMLVFYTVATILSPPEIQCDPRYGYIGNPFIRWVCYWLYHLVKESPNQSESTPTPLRGLLAVIQRLMKGVIASPMTEEELQKAQQSASEPIEDSQRSKSQTTQHQSSLRDYVGEKQERFFSLAEYFLSGIRWFAGYLLQLRIQVGIMLICLLLFQTQQVKDVVLAMVLDGSPRHFVMAALLGALLSLLLWHTSRQLTRLLPDINKCRELAGKMGGKAKSLERSGIFSYTFEMVLFWLSWVSLALFTVPVAREAYGGPVGGGNWNLYVLLLLGALMIFLWRLLDRPSSTWKGSFRYWFYALFGLSLLLPSMIQGLTANQLPHLLGSVALLFWALSIFLIMSSTVYQFSLITNFPLFSLLLAGVYLININRLNDNHAVRLLSHGSTSNGLPQQMRANRSLPSLEEAFNAWCTERRKSTPAGASFQIPNPVYIVSAQGGGIYAAYHTAKSLAVLSEEVPGFSDHLFAISGVSGGSVGATVFVNSLRTANPDKQGEFKRGELSDRIDAYFDAHNDRLAMILSTMLFGDTIQRFYPIPVPAWDRSLGLELGIENLYPYRSPGSESPPPIQLDRSFYRDQDPELHGDRSRAPYLALNTTEVENGRRYILSPFRISSRYSDADFHEPWLRRPEQMKPLDLRYSTAAGMSARFPIVSPYGFFPEARARRFIDGGLYDNSGAITAKEIIDELRSLASAKKWPIEIIPIAIMDQKAVNLDSSYADAENLVRHQEFRLFGWSAIDAVLSTREARLQKAVDLLDSAPSPPTSTTSTPSTKEQEAGVRRRILLRKEFRLAGDPMRIFSIPLGWKLSCQARAFINDQIQPYPKNVKDSSTPETAEGDEYRMVPCELTIQAVKREPVRTQLDNGPRNSSLSQAFLGADSPASPGCQPAKAVGLGFIDVASSFTSTVTERPNSGILTY